MEPDPEQRVRVRAVVSGVVQGVGFRAATEREARRLGLSGWVRNRDDGSVELEAEGPPAQVGALVAWCGRGPPGARVDEVESTWIPATGERRGFTVAATRSSRS